MKKIKYLLFLIGFVTFIPAVSAASISVSTSSNTAVVGNNITAYINISSDVEAWDFIVGYDTSRLRLVSSNLESTAHSVSTSSLHSRSYSITFRAISSGSAGIYISSADCANVTCSKGSKTVTLKTQAEIEASYSKNNNLSALSIDGVELSPAFNKDTLEYLVELKPETTSVNVNASVEDSTARVTGNGTREVTDGDNNLEIVVTAENGTTRTYKIKATVKEYNPITVKVDEKNYTVVRKKSNLIAPNNYKETTVKINNEDVPAFTSEITKYTLVALKDEKGNQNFYIYEKNNYKLYKEFKFNNIVLYPMELNKIPSGYFKTTIKYNENKINAYKIDKDSDYALIYGMNVETGKINTYTYDSKENTVQIYDDEYIKKISKETELYLKILIAVSGCLVLSIGTIIFILIKNNKKIKPEKIKNEKIKDIQ